MHPASNWGEEGGGIAIAKKLAKDLGVGLKGIVGSGPNGRLVAKDVEAALASVKASGGAAPGAAALVGLPSGVELGSIVAL
ncbi:hypothetical protein OROMI_025460 [Orobanche minor]